MQRFILIVVVLHGLIHAIGFAKAIRSLKVNGPAEKISRVAGISWLLAATLFLATAVTSFLDYDLWWIGAFASLLLSQLLIISKWRDARWGTPINIALCVWAISGLLAWNFKRDYADKVRDSIHEDTSAVVTLLEEKDIAHLPYAVQRYLRYCNVLHKPVVTNFKVCFRGRIRKNDGSGWMNFSSEQFNFIRSTRRFFFMDATMKHLPVSGFHCFNNASAFMDIRLASALRIVYESGPEMDTAETVTFFNDMCCLAPATLIDSRIRWFDADSEKVRTVFTNNGISISAWLYFNKDGALTNFVSSDRYATMNDGSMKKLRWATPLKDYRMTSDTRLAHYAETIYTYPEGDFCYGEFRATAVAYNVRQH